MLRCTLVLAFTVAVAASSRAQSPQVPWKGENLQYFPKDITRERLTQRMREFSFALNVRCQYCHAGGDGISFEGVDFSSDDKPAKNKARAMLRLTDQVNKTLLPEVPSRADPADDTAHHCAVPSSARRIGSLRPRTRRAGGARTLHRNPIS